MVITAKLAEQQTLLSYPAQGALRDVQPSAPSLADVALTGVNAGASQTQLRGGGMRLLPGWQGERAGRVADGLDIERVDRVATQGLPSHEQPAGRWPTGFALARRRLVSVGNQISEGGSATNRAALTEILLAEGGQHEPHPAQRQRAPQGVRRHPVLPVLPQGDCRHPRRSAPLDRGAE